MGDIVELVVTKGKTVKTRDKEEWKRVEYSVKANIDSDQELDVAKATIEGRLDGWLANVLPPAATTEKAETEPSLPGSEDLSQLPWKSYQTKQTAKENEAGWICAITKGAEALLASLKAKDKVQMGKFEYNLSRGRDKQFISRKPVK